MKTYEVVTDCIRMPFDKRRFRKGEIIELADDVDPGGCFKQIDGPVTVAEPVSDAMSLSEMQKKQTEATTPKSGFASSLNQTSQNSKHSKTTK